jgi:hypothetical protein
MKNKTLRSLLGGALFFTLGAFVPAYADATIWNGPNITFSKPNFGNPTLAANQDRMTALTWLTRGSSQGLFNAHNESSFFHFLSPSGTEWADGTLANYSSLHYTDWNTWVKGVHAGPPSTVGVPAVLHLEAENIFLSITFTSWTGSGGGGGFSYIRSTLVPEPSTGVLALAGLAFAAAVRRKTRN